MKVQLSLVFAVLSVLVVNAQEAYWDTYLARYDDGVGSVTLNMDLMEIAPKPELPFLIITGVDVKGCTGEGFPKKDEFNKLYKISNEVNKVIFASTNAELAGTFTYQCQRLDYLFVKDTLALREKLVQRYKRSYQSHTYHVTIRRDEDWDAYLNFLYPNAETKAFMQNSRVVDQMKEAGDRLDQPRIISHFIYFDSREGRSLFSEYVTGLKFKVEMTRETKGKKYPYLLQIARPDVADFEMISKVTKALREKAAAYGGEYDGWTASVISK